MNSLPDIDQVIVRKTGGYNLKSVEWWTSLRPSEQMALISESSVQFFASGMEVDSDVAMKQLAPDVAASIAAPSTEKATTMSWPPAGFKPAPATYSRLVVEGPRWIVNKRTDAGTVELFSVRGRTNALVYDLKKPLGVQLLSDDLLLDALGYDETNRHIVQEHQQAFQYFREQVFSVHLGDRQWETTDAKIRSTISSNPYLDLVTETDALAGF